MSDTILVHPGTYVRQNVIPKGTTVKKAAETVGVGRAAMSNFLNGKAALSSAMATRLERAFGADRENLLRLQREFDQHSNDSDAIRVKGYAPSFLEIRAKNLEEWADAISTRSLLPALIRRLVTTSGPRVLESDFPAHDYSQTHGWDGYVVAESPNSWVPVGKSGWEFGCNLIPSKKADDDYKARLALAPDIRKETTFVFVTPRRWHAKKTWAETKRGKKEWKNVLAFDASDLEQWLEVSPPAQVWLAEQFNLPRGGCHSLTQFWHDWSHTASPTISPLIFRSAIESHKETLTSWLEAEPSKPLVVTGAAKEEALAFIACLADSDDELSEFREAALVITDPEMIHRLSKTTTEIIPVVYTDEAEIEAQKCFKDRHTVIVTERRSADINADISIEPPSSQDVSDALKKMGFDDAQTEIHSNQCGNSPTILRRQLASVPALRRPSWAGQEERVTAMVPYVLVGTWDSARDGDREILRAISDKEPKEIERDVSLLADLDDAPIWREGTYRGVVSTIDCLLAISGQITTQDLEDFLFVAEVVLSEDDPALDLDRDDRWAANIYDKVRDHSGAIRRSICETLIILSIYGDALFGSRVGTSVSRLVATLIRKLLENQDARVWQSQKGELPMYAEAAPEVFLEIVEAELASGDPAFAPLFLPASNGVFSGCDRTGMLWALELLAWDAIRLPRVARVLAQLSLIEIDDNWVNKPINSLRDILLHWMPHTAARVEQRIETIKALNKTFPEIGWSICYEQLKPGSSMTSGTCRPKFRNDASGAGQITTIGESNKFRVACWEELLSWDHYDVDKLKDLVECLPSIAKTDRDRVYTIIESWYRECPASDDVIELREYVRRRTFTRRGKKRNKESVERYADGLRLYKLLELSDPIDRNFWLFKEHWIEFSPEELEEEDLDFKKRDRRLEEQRINALSEILGVHGFDGLISLAEKGNAATVIGYLATRLIGGDQINAFIEEVLNSDGFKSSPFKMRNLLSGVLHALGDKVRRDVVLGLEAKYASKLDGFALMNAVYIAMPFGRSTWDHVEELSQMAQEQYWKLVSPSWTADAEESMDYVIEHLLDVGRPRAAFHLIDIKPTNASSKSLVTLLDAIAQPTGEFDSDMIPASHSIERVFESLNEREDVDQHVMARLEFFYIQVLTPFQKYGLPNLSKEVASSPRLFMQLVATCFKRKDGRNDPDGSKLYTDDNKSEEIIAAAFRATDHINVIPGTDKNGKINGADLRDWINEVRKLASELSRKEITDQRIGQLLSHTPVDERDNVWPLQEIREVIEPLASKDIATGMEIGLFNSHGAEWVDSRNKREWENARRYREMASKENSKHPFVGKMLLSIAESYEGHAKWHERDERIDRRLRGR